MHSTVTLSATRRQVEAKQMEAYTKEADAIIHNVQASPTMW